MFLLLLNVLPCDPDGLAPGSVHTATLKNFFSKKSEYSSGKTQHESATPHPKPFFLERYPIIDRETVRKPQIARSRLPPHPCSGRRQTYTFNQRLITPAHSV